MRKSTGFALLSIFLVALFLRLLPLMRNLYWGADFGEYFFLSNQLVGNGHISLDYDGWGFTYPYFPGMIVISSVLGLAGLSLPLSVAIVSVFLASLSVLPIFLIGRFLSHDDLVGLSAAAVVAVGMPSVYTTSHATPGSVGDLLLVTCLLLFLKAHKNPRFYFLLYPITVALTVTHHLSSYFLIIMLIASVFFQEVLSKKSESRSLRLSVAYIAFLITINFLYWIGYATPFRDVVLTKLLGTWWATIIAFAFGVLILFALVRLRRRSEWSYVPRYPTLGNRSVFLVIGIATTFTILAVIVFFAVPGTTIAVDESAFIYIAPLLVLMGMGIPGRGFTSFSRRGLDLTSWFIALAGSLVFASLFAKDVLIPYRHMQYMMIPAALLIGFSISRLSGMLGAIRRRGQVLAGILVVLLLFAVAGTSYPPRIILSGHEEGIAPELVSNSQFTNIYVDGLVATDHRASTVVFGFGERNATWDTAPDSLLADSFNEAEPEMTEVKSPSGKRRVDYVLVDEDIKKGALIFPWDPASVPSDEAIAKFDDEPYMKFFDNGYSQLYCVNWGLA